MSFTCAFRATFLYNSIVIPLVRIPLLRSENNCIFLVFIHFYSSRIFVFLVSSRYSRYKGLDCNYSNYDNCIIILLLSTVQYYLVLAVETVLCSGICVNFNEGNGRSKTCRGIIVSFKVFVVYIRISNSFQNFILFGGRRSRSCVRIYRNKFERNYGVPRVSLPQKKNGANGNVNCGSGV